MDYEDGRFSSHPIFSYFAMNSVMRWECMKKGTVYVSRHRELKGKNVEVLKEMMMAGMKLGKDIMVYSSNIRTSREYWMSRSSELQAMVTTLGLPSIFFSLSAADFHWPRLFDLLKESSGRSNLTEKERHKLMLENPKICCDYFFIIVEVYLNDIIIIKFKVKDQWYRFEWQVSLIFHFFLLIVVIYLLIFSVYSSIVVHLIFMESFGL